MSELITMDREYVTRDGKPVRVLCVDLRGDEWTVVALVQNECRERLITYRADGRYSAISESKEDLIPKPKRHKRTAWMNVYPDYPGNVHESRAEADGLSGAGRIACLELHLDFAEGEGLEVRDE
jgi:hypothetical protein